MHYVGGKDYGSAPTAHFKDNVFEQFLIQWVESGKRLIENYKVRVVYDRDGKLELLVHPA